VPAQLAATTLAMMKAVRFMRFLEKARAADRCYASAPAT
jgi:hypothetical protein